MRGLKLGFLMAFILGVFLWSGMLLAQDASFGPSIRVDDADTSSWGCFSPTLAVDRNGNIYVAWQDGRKNQGWDIYFSSSFDGGTTWSKNVMVSDKIEPPIPTLSLEVDAKGNLYLVWEDMGTGNVYFSMSRDSGKSWTSEIQVNDWGHCSAKMSPSLAVDDTGITYVTWADDRWGPMFPGICFSMSTNAGTTWVPNVWVIEPNDVAHCLSSIALDRQGNIYVVWVDSITLFSADIYFSKSIDGGKRWSPKIKVNNVPGGISFYPSIAIDKGGIIYVVWQYEFRDVYLGRSTDGGITWNDPSIKVNNDSLSANDAQPQIDVDDKGKLYVVWDAASQILFAMSSDSGRTWSDPSIRVDDSTLFLSADPCLDLGPDGIYVAFRSQKQTGAPHVYFTKGSLTGIKEEPGDGYQILDYRLKQNWPNPFNATTIINYELRIKNSPIHTILKIYNILGQEVKTLVSEEQRGGSYEVTWDGRDNTGSPVASGLYLCRLEVKGDGLKATRTKKLVLLR